MRRLRILFVSVALCANAWGQSFVNFETAHVHPLDVTPDGTRLLAVNTADNRLEVFHISAAGGLTHSASIPVGLDPVSVRARTNTEAWVANYLSDTVSIVNLTTRNVVATLPVGDEPADVIFAGAPQRAFVTMSQESQVWVFDPANLAAAPAILPIEGIEPRALATDGQYVYVAIFESGNATTIVPESLVSSAAFNPYPGAPNPPPNSGSGFDPPLTPGLPTAPRSSLIVKRTPSGAWVDDNGGDWSAAVGWDLHDHDVAIINANTFATTYATGLMNINMAIAVRPGGGVTTVGTDALNHIRFEPNINGLFLRVLMGAFDPSDPPQTTNVLDLNPHLDYMTNSIPIGTRVLSIGDPRGIVWTADGSTAYVSGMGSNNVIVMQPDASRLDTIPVGQGPTGLALDENRNRLYVLNKFDATISVVNLATNAVASTASLYDPTPDEIRLGRPHLYDTHRSSGLGIISCASCHVDGRFDQLAWDLGNPAGALEPFNQVCQGGNFCEDFHPLKGPMVTQTLIGIIGTEPLHWRGDREDLAGFNEAFVNLMAADDLLTAQEMDEFQEFLEYTSFQPNPYRLIDNTIPNSLFNGGNPVNGRNLFRNVRLDLGVLTCNDCHTITGGGTNGEITPGVAMMSPQSMKVAQLRNMYQKTGFDKTSLASDKGFGFTHDGVNDTLIDFLQFPGFNFAGGATGAQQRRDVEAFLLTFPTGTHSGIGRQTTVVNGAAIPPGQQNLINAMIAQANTGEVGLVVKGRQAGLQRGYTYLGGGNFQSDRLSESVATAALLASAAPGSELTFTLVPAGSEFRIGIDRDEDGYLDRDELDACSDPADPLSTPLNGGLTGDLDGDNHVGLNDLLIVLGDFGCTGGACPGDADGDGQTGLNDILLVLANFGATCPQ